MSAFRLFHRVATQYCGVSNDGNEEIVARVLKWGIIGTGGIAPEICP